MKSLLEETLGNVTPEERMKYKKIAYETAATTLGVLAKTALQWEKKLKEEIVNLDTPPSTHV